MRSVDVILLMLHRSESVFDKSSDEEMLEMSCDEYPVRTKQKTEEEEEKEEEKEENLRGKGGGLTTTNNYG